MFYILLNNNNNNKKRCYQKNIEKKIVYIKQIMKNQRKYPSIFSNKIEYICRLIKPKSNNCALLSSKHKKGNKKWGTPLISHDFSGLSQLKNFFFFQEGKAPFWNEIGQLPKGGWTEKPSFFFKEKDGTTGGGAIIFFSG